MMINKIFKVMLGAAIALSTTSCIKDAEEEDYADWRDANVKFVEEQEALKVNGENYYTKIVPSWARGIFVLVKWHNNPELTSKNPSPLYNSTCDIVYRGTDMTGEPFDSSYNISTYGDSIFRSQPSSLVSGFACALMNMHVGDSCKIVIPYQAGYGSTSTTKLKPYSTLIFEVKLKDIPAYEVPN